MNYIYMLDVWPANAGENEADRVAMTQRPEDAHLLADAWAARGFHAIVSRAGREVYRVAAMLKQKGIEAGRDTSDAR